MPTPQRLTGSEKLAIDSVCTRFEEQWPSVGTESIERCLNEVTNDLRSELLRELIAVEIELRLQRHEQPHAADYLTRFPENSIEIEQAFAGSQAVLVNEPTLINAPRPLDPAATVEVQSPLADSASSLRVGADVVDMKLPGYRVDGLLGRGGMGMVLRCWDEKLHRAVAIKVLLPQLASDGNFRQRFMQEARASAAIRHPNVVTLYTVEEQNEPPFLVLELVEGESLATRLEATPALPIDEVVMIATDLAAGLAAAHARGIVHRDIKPGNVLLDATDGRARLTDFGLARVSSMSGLTTTGNIAGTPQYMSPEQVEGRAVDQRSDLFSLGAVLYRMVSGQPAFAGDSVIALARQICDRDPAPIGKLKPDIPQWLTSVIQRLLAKQPEDRLQSAEELVQLLRSQQVSGKALVAPRLPKHFVTFSITAVSIVAVLGAFWMNRPQTRLTLSSEPPVIPAPTAANVIGATQKDGKTTAPEVADVALWNVATMLKDSGQRLGNSDMSDAAAADIDNDGDLDLIVACGRGLSPQPSEVWLNDGRGKFDLGQLLAPESGPRVAGGVAVGDLDGDHDLDVWIANWSDEPDISGDDVLWLNDGKGKFKESSQLLDSGNGIGVSLSDVDADGDLDVWVANFRQSKQLWFNDGRGQFTDSGQTFSPFNTVAVAFGPIVGKNTVDAATYSVSSPNLQVWSNDGRGRFRSTFEMPLVGNALKGFLANLDGDSRPDAVIATEAGLCVCWHKANGAFELGPVLSSNRGAWCAAASDLNSDGNVDLIYVEGSSRHLHVALNEGTRKFGIPQQFTDFAGADFILSRDFDKDGDEDLYLGFGNVNRPQAPDRLLLNQSR